MKRTHLGITINEDLKDFLKIKAQKQKRSLCNFVEILLEEYKETTLKNDKE